MYCHYVGPSEVNAVFPNNNPLKDGLSVVLNYESVSIILAISVANNAP